MIQSECSKIKPYHIFVGVGDRNGKGRRERIKYGLSVDERFKVKNRATDSGKIGTWFSKIG